MGGWHRGVDLSSQGHFLPTSFFSTLRPLPCQAGSSENVELDGEWMEMGVEGPILFPVLRDGHKPNSGALMSIIRIPVIKGGMTLSI